MPDGGMVSRHGYSAALGECVGAFLDSIIAETAWDPARNHTRSLSFPPVTQLH
jgi:hypothetical protein